MNYVPIVVEQNGNGERAFDIYSRLLQDRIILLSGEINDHMANIIISELLYLDSINHNDISLYINSPGGSITSGFAIYDTMNYIKSNVNTICVGMAASMGAFLLASGSKRFALENSEIMIHQPLGGAKGQATDISIAAKRILKLKDKINTILSQKTNQDKAVIEAETERDFFMDASEALRYGIIDEVIKKVVK